MNEFEKKAKLIYELIKKSPTIILHRHINPDGDALGSQWGLKKIINENFPNKRVLAPGDTSAYMSKNFTDPDIVTADDYQDDTLVIITDTANRERISGEFWNRAGTIVKIDHHPETDHYGKINLVDVKAVAACQIVAKFAYILNLTVNADAARHLFLGLVTDSDRFLYRNVTHETFVIATFLVGAGFSLIDLYHNLYLQNIRSVRIKGYIMSNFKVSENGVGYFICDKTLLKKIAVSINKHETKILHSEHQPLIYEDITNHVNVMANIEGIKIWFIAAQNEVGNQFKVSVRSSGWQINNLVAKFNGGGHSNAAGCTVKNLSEVKKLLASLNHFAATTKSTLK